MLPEFSPLKNPEASGPSGPLGQIPTYDAEMALHHRLPFGFISRATDLARRNASFTGIQACGVVKTFVSSGTWSPDIGWKMRPKPRKSKNLIMRTKRVSMVMIDSIIWSD